MLEIKRVKPQDQSACQRLHKHSEWCLHQYRSRFPRPMVRLLGWLGGDGLCGSGGAAGGAASAPACAACHVSVLLLAWHLALPAAHPSSAATPCPDQHPCPMPSPTTNRPLASTSMPAACGTAPPMAAATRCAAAWPCLMPATAAARSRSPTYFRAALSGWRQVTAALSWYPSTLRTLG